MGVNTGKRMSDHEDIEVRIGIMGAETTAADPYIGGVGSKRPYLYTIGEDGVNTAAGVIHTISGDSVSRLYTIGDEGST